MKPRTDTSACRRPAVDLLTGRRLGNRVPETRDTSDESLTTARKRSHGWRGMRGSLPMGLSLGSRVGAF